MKAKVALSPVLEPYVLAYTCTQTLSILILIQLQK